MKPLGKDTRCNPPVNLVQGIATSWHNSWYCYPHRPPAGMTVPCPNIFKSFDLTFKNVTLFVITFSMFVLDKRNTSWLCDRCQPARNHAVFLWNDDIIWGELNPNGFNLELLNSLRSSDAYMRQYNISTLVQIKACRLAGAKPLFGPMMKYCSLDSWKQTSVQSQSKYIHFHSGKCVS